MLYKKGSEIAHICMLFKSKGWIKFLDAIHHTACTIL